MATNYKTMMQIYRDAVEEYLEGCFIDDCPQRALLDAMRYSLLAGGKRIRPVLVVVSGRMHCLLLLQLRWCIPIA